MVTTSLPLFPLGTVLFPGIALPLHIFEERYRRLVRDLLELTEQPRRFGVVAIKAGREVGIGAADDLFGVGCTADLRRVEAYDDGRFDIVAVGGSRFRLTDVHPGELVRGDVEFLPEAVSERTTTLAATAGRLFLAYRSAVLTAQGSDAGDDPELPADPVERSYLIAAATVLDLTDKQRLLEAATVDDRLALEAGLLRREIRLVTQLATRPGSEFGRGQYHPN